MNVPSCCLEAFLQKNVSRVPLDEIEFMWCDVLQFPAQWGEFKPKPSKPSIKASKPPSSAYPTYTSSVSISNAHSQRETSVIGDNCWSGVAWTSHLHDSTSRGEGLWMQHPADECVLRIVMGTSPQPVQSCFALHAELDPFSTQDKFFGQFHRHSAS